jgi:ABC-type nitrate/sulfonate/bicarbonate transport system substrate-binding protein
MRLAHGKPLSSSFAFLFALVAALAVVTPLKASAVALNVTHWQEGMYGVPFAVALEKGYFKEAGLDVSGFLTSQGGGSTVRNAMASEVPYGEVALPAAIAAIKQGVPLVIVHGLVFSSWIVLLVAQTSLVAGGRLDLHRRLGLAGMAIAALMIVIGPMTAVAAARRDVAVDGAPALRFLLTPLTDIVVFGALVWNAFLLRRSRAVGQSSISYDWVIVIASQIEMPTGHVFSVSSIARSTDSLRSPAPSSRW